MKTIITNATETAAFFNVSRQTIYDWTKAGLPKIGRGKYDLKAAFEWYTENILLDRTPSEDEDLTSAKRRYWQSKADMEALKVGREKEELIPVKEIQKKWADRAAEYKNGCFNLVYSLPPLLEGKPQSEIREVIEKQVWKMFDRVYREGRFCPRAKLADAEILKLWKSTE